MDRRSDEERNALAEAHLYLAAQAVGRLWRRADVRRYGRDDALQFCRLALLRAAAAWDPARGLPFAPYAWWLLLKELGREAVRDGVVRGGRRRGQATCAPGDRGAPLLDEHEARGPAPAEAAAAAELWDAVGRLPKRQAEVLRAVYAEGLTLADVGRRWDCSREWARRVERDGMAELRENLGEG